MKSYQISNTNSLMDELLKSNHIYREVFESQQQGSGDADLAGDGPDGTAGGED